MFICEIKNQKKDGICQSGVSKQTLNQWFVSKYAYMTRNVPMGHLFKPKYSSKHGNKM